MWKYPWVQNIYVFHRWLFYYVITSPKLVIETSHSTEGFSVYGYLKSKIVFISCTVYEVLRSVISPYLMWVILLVCCIGSLYFVMCMNITKIFNSGSFVGLWGMVEKTKTYLTFSILPNCLGSKIGKIKIPESYSVISFIYMPSKIPLYCEENKSQLL